MSSRDAILARIRANKPAARARPTVPSFDAGDASAGQRRDRFCANFKAMGGTLLAGEGANALAAVRALLAPHAVIVSRVAEIAGNRPLDAADEPASLHDVDVAVVRALFGVAETGSLAFTDAAFGINTLAYLAQHLVVLLDPAAVVADMHAAYARADFAAAPYAVFHTGPSATADIEGVLIHGAQGVRSLSLAFVTPS